MILDSKGVSNRTTVHCKCMLVQTQKVNVLVDPKGLFDFVLNFLQISSRQDPLKYSPIPFYQLRQRTALEVEEVAESYMINTK